MWGMESIQELGHTVVVRWTGKGLKVRNKPRPDLVGDAESNYRPERGGVVDPVAGRKRVHSFLESGLGLLALQFPREILGQVVIGGGGLFEEGRFHGRVLEGHCA